MKVIGKVLENCLMCLWKWLISIEVTVYERWLNTEPTIISLLHLVDDEKQ